MRGGSSLSTTHAICIFKKEFLFQGVALRAVDGVSLRIHRGEVVELVGESGCGKSTLGRTLLKLAAMNEGRLVFDGEDITSYNKRQMHSLRKRMQMIFQDPYAALNPRMTCFEAVEAPLK
ncbi:MAG: ATP-binding cassette domain-containing protein, partial [Clostridiales Family XIII bacterium]|nr:ATP-binding cassette domain-containing protein [Clostridiales Family XIII bacterium]